MSGTPLRSNATSEWWRPLGIDSRSSISADMVRSRGCATGNSAGDGSRRPSAARSGSRRRWPTSHTGSATDPTATLRAFAAPCSARSCRYDDPSDSHMAVRALRRAVASLEAAADCLDQHLASAVEVAVAAGDQAEHPARQELLDRAVEPHRRELRIDVVAELAGRLGVGDDLGDQIVGAADLG